MSFGCSELLGPSFEPTGSLVAIAVPGEDLARVGPVTVQSGELIRLHAVLLGKEDGATVYYTDASHLEIDGEMIAVEALRSWPKKHIKCLWQTLEAPGPFIKVGTIEQLGNVGFVNFSHPDWGLQCTAEAVITARQREALIVPDDQRRLAFGRQNYQVWVEMFEKADSLVSKQSFKSPGAADLVEDPDGFPRVQMQLAGRLRASAAVFGLSQLEPTLDATEEVWKSIHSIHRRGLFFNRKYLFKDLLLGRGVAELDWRLIELDDGRPFVAEGADRDGKSVRPGDILRVGERLVVLFRDAGEVGVLDSEDLCFDYAQGATVRRLRDVFAGDSDGDVDWASPNVPG